MTSNYGVPDQHDVRYSYSNRNEDRRNETFLLHIESNSDYNNNETRNLCNNVQNDITYYDMRKIDWIFDSGFSDHIVNDDSYIYEYEDLQVPARVKVDDGRSLECTKVGNIATYFVVNNAMIEIKISNVFYIQNIDKNLISYAKVTDSYKVISVGNISKIYNRYGKLTAIAHKENGKYKLGSYIERNNFEVNSIKK